MSRWSSPLALVSLAVCLVVAAPASAVRLATPAEAKAIRAAIHTYVDCCTAVDWTKVKIGTVRVGTVNRRYGRADLYASNIGGETVVLLRTARGWKVARSGSADLGCGLPIVVRVDLWLECNGRIP